MQKIAPVYIATRKKWRTWLANNHAFQTTVWLQFFKVHTGKPCLAYDDAVEEALCFGWIDSTVRRIDDDSYVRKFSPRHKGSVWSDLNRTRMDKMIAAGLARPAGRAVYDPANLPINIPVCDLPRIAVPADLRKALAANPDAKRYFKKLTNRYTQMCLRWITTAKKPETRAKRVAEFVDVTAKNQRIGMK